MFRLGVVSFLGGQTEDETMQRKTCATILTAEEPYTRVGEKNVTKKKMALTLWQQARSLPHILLLK